MVSGQGSHLNEELVYCSEPFSDIKESRGSKIQKQGLISFAIDEIEQIKPKLLFLHIDNIENFGDILSHGYRIISTEVFWTKRSIEKWWSFELTESKSIIFERIMTDVNVDQNPQAMLDRLFHKNKGLEIITKNLQ